MIKAEELRYKNWLYAQDYGQYVQVTGFSEALSDITCFVPGADYDTWEFECNEGMLCKELSPIELTPDVLGKIKGYEKVVRVYPSEENEWEGNSYQYISDMDFERYALFTIDNVLFGVQDGYCIPFILIGNDDGSDSLFNAYGMKFKHLHEIQNFFALWGKELEVEL